MSEKSAVKTSMEKSEMAGIIIKPYGKKISYDLVCPEQPHGRTKQSFREECDINTIMARYQNDGLIEWVNKNSPAYGDARGLDFDTCMQVITEARASFDALPAHIRKRFNNDPAQFVDFFDDENNRKEAIELGLIAPDPDPALNTDPGPEPASGDPEPVATPPKGGKGGKEKTQPVGE